MDDVIKKIASLSGLGMDEVLALIDEKKEEFSGMISDEGAASIIAKELGLSLLRDEKIKIKDLKPGMKNVEITAKITGLVEREYESERGKGVVCNLFLQDDTGSIRAVLWNAEIDALGEAKKGDSIRFKGYVKQNNIDEPELRLGFSGSVEMLTQELNLAGSRRTKLADLKEGTSCECRAAVVQVFESNMFYEICPECHVRLKKEANFVCEEHGSVEPSYAMVLSCIIDDGSANTRAVFFSAAAESLLGLNTKEAWRLFVAERSLKPLYKRVSTGVDFVFEGRVRMNKFFSRPEFIVNSVKSVDVKKEIETMLG